MKKNDTLLFGSTLLFSGLFYQQSAGINYLLFTLLLSALLLILNPEQLKSKSWWFYCGCINLAGLSVFIINSNLSLLACLLSLLVFSSKSVSRSNSVLLSLFFGAYSVLSASVHWIIELSDQRDAARKEGKHLSLKITGSILLAVITALLFFHLYRLSNPLFSDFTKKINLNWLSLGWIFFTLIGLLIMYGLLRSKTIGLLVRLDLLAQKDIQKPGAETTGSSNNPALIAFSLFVMLNGMLLFLNGLDIHNIYFTGKLPAGVSLSDFVHQSVWSTVVSIVIAVSLIALFFKSTLNFSEQGRKIKFLVYLWMVQSAIVVIHTAVRNYWYIQSYQLTYLRIGVFVFLCLCLLGLVFTWLKIAKQQSAWKLATRNLEAWFVLLVMAGCLNWDKMITIYNIEHATIKKPLDTAYIFRLSDANLPELVELHNRSQLNIQDRIWLYQKMIWNYKKTRFRQWQSFNLRSQDNREAMYRLKLK